MFFLCLKGQSLHRDVKTTYTRFLTTLSGNLAPFKIKQTTIVYFSEKTRLGISFESTALQPFDMKCQALFSKRKQTNNITSSAALVKGA